ncbi:MAG: CopG family transcriptional regulator [Haloferacaceae archaeon]
MAEDGGIAIVDAFDRWLDERADELGVSREAVLARILAGIEEPATAVGDEHEHEHEGGAGATLDLALDLDDSALVDGEALDGLDERIAALDDRVTALEGRERIDPDRVADLSDRIDDLGDRIEDVEADEAGALDDRVADLADRVTALEDDLDEKIQDVRERVIQVKREADAKAPADHDHGALRDRVERTAAAVEELDARLDDLERRVDEGFENFEEVLEYLTETSDELEGRAETLARATIGLRDRVADLEAERSARAVADDIRATANRNGDSTATCGACSRRVQLGLLSRAECPHCTAAFEDLDPSSGLFGSATLLVGPPPALEGETGDVGAASPADLFEEDENREDER